MSGIELTRRVRSLKPSATIATANRAKALKAAGRDIIAFAAGQPDFDTPEVVKEAAIDALRKGQTKYTQTLGDPETRQAVADYLTRRSGILGLAGDNVGIAAGGKHALFVACHCLLEPDEQGQPQGEVLIPTPGWVSYDPIARLAGGIVRELPTTKQSGFKITPTQLDDAITPNTRILILNSPSNPTGTMYTPAELEALAEVVAGAIETKAPRMVVLTDEIYERIVFDGGVHKSFGSIPSVAERTITINGLSKSHAMTGWRIGFIACPGDTGKAFIKGYATLQGQMTTNITSIVYAAIRVAMASCEDDVERMRLAFAERAKLTTTLLAEVPGFDFVKPQGAFYVFPDISSTFGKKSPKGRPINCALDFADALLEESEVAVVPGEDFGGCGQNHIRISFACSEADIKNGIARIRNFVESLSD